jgi:histidyl-tRNA synthetase
MTAEENDLPLAPPRGMRDFYPEDMAVRNAVFDAWKAAAAAHGFVPYDSCVVEQLSLLKRKAGEEIVDQIYAFTDKSGRELALRPEMTPTLARMVAARQSALTMPLKWYTIAQCFRYERMSKGRKREHYQWNLDIIGEPSVAAETDVLTTATAALSALGLGATDYRIHVNSRAVLSELLAASGIPADKHPTCLLALDKRGKMPDAEIEQMLRDAGIAPEQTPRVFDILKLDSLESVRAHLGSPTSVALDRLCALFDMGAAYGIGDILKFDIGVVRGLTYYTGIVFEAFDVNRELRAIFGGGRYDNLLGDLGGSPATAVGLGFGDVVVAELLASKGRTGAISQSRLDLAVGFMTEDQRLAAVRFGVAMRKKGLSVDIALAPEKPKHFFSRTGRGAFRQAAYLGPDDISKGTVRIKDLATRSETEAPIA